ncbi:L,D-transpeptidase [[Mycobacterium] burgundiense]|uniref:Ig-like domain-containing protein n=1 Tax=[Mycobacterium] burgundiense TaxID=3064286 RepID=A0ABN9N3S0_9MYCO|nr:Ig-like domain-containing protein [Mycolicibacterium sp. MU0053]CAJ1499990.1 Ig-like domain-containing protein [Mycolicibacterium sp. MU0053]
MWQVRSVARPRGFRSWLAVLLLIPAVILGVSACGATTDSASEQRIADKGTPFGDLLVPRVTASFSDGAVGVPVDKPVTITASAGVLDSVVMTNESGTVVAGKLSSDGLTWETAEPLGFNKTYTVNARSLGLGGVTTRQLSFETHSPENQTMPYLMPNDGQTVGVGQPIAIRFDENIPNRVAAERAIKVTTKPAVDGAFYWLNNREVRWRPAQYWKPGTTVEVAVNTYGVDLGDGLFGQGNANSTFTIGDEVISTVDDNTKTLTVRVNGEVVKTMPISMGKNSTPTPNGVYIIGDRYEELVMDSSTYGVPVNSPNGYRTEVDFATQMSYSGIYVHGAPWSVGSQGYDNVSHGCINVTTSNAQWFYNNSKRGDIVEVVNSVGSTLPGTDGLGDWNIPWKQWQAGNSSA